MLRLWASNVIPASPLRDEVVPRPVVRKEPSERTDAEVPEHAGHGDSNATDEKPTGQKYVPWCALLKRVFGIDILTCPRCKGRRHMISVITDPGAVGRIIEAVRRTAKNRGSPADGGEAQIPLPPRQGRLDFAGPSADRLTGTTATTG